MSASSSSSPSHKMAGLCPHRTTLFFILFVVVTSLQYLHVRGSLTVTGVHHPVTQVACRYPRKDLFILTLKETANTSCVRSADIKDICSGDMMFSACTFDDTCVTVKALVVGQGSEGFRVFECKATLKVNSESREIPVGQINITVGGPSTPTYTTTGTDVNESAKDFTGTCDSRDAPRAAVIVLVLLLIVFMVISAVLVIKIHRRTNTPCPCHVTRLCAGWTASQPVGPENDSNTQHLENSTPRYHKYRAPPPASPAPRAPGKSHVMDYQDQLDLSSAHTSQTLAGTTEELCQYQTPWGQGQKVFPPQ